MKKEIEASVYKLLKISPSNKKYIVGGHQFLDMPLQGHTKLRIL
jgi:hypothetical protein